MTINFLEEFLRAFGKRPKHFPFGDHSINSHVHFLDYVVVFSGLTFWRLSYNINSFLNIMVWTLGVPWVPEVFLACGGNFRCWPKADTSSAVGRRHERRSREKNLWHGAVLFTVPVDLWAFLSDYIYANQTESLRLWSCGPTREEMSKDPHYP